MHFVVAEICILDRESKDLNPGRNIETLLNSISLKVIAVKYDKYPPGDEAISYIAS